MVKTGYALTLFAAASIAAPVPVLLSSVGGLAGHLLPSGLNVRRDGSGNLIGAGADSGIGQLLHSLTGRDVHEHEERQLSGILGSLPLIGDLTGGDKADHKQGQDKKEGADKHAHQPRASGGLLSGAVGNLLRMPERRDITKHEARQLDPLGQLGELTGKLGLGGLSGNSQHGIGLLRHRRDSNEHDARSAPIEGATLTGVLLNGGVLGQLAGVIQ